MTTPKKKFDLIVTVVPKGQAHVVVDASRQAGAEGATILPARGSGIHEQKKLLGIPIEPEKDVVFTLLPADIAEAALDAIVEAAELDKPGHGVAFVLEVKNVVGITRLLDDGAQPRA